MELWQRLLVVAGVVALATVLAKLVDWRMARRELPPEAVTRYRVLRRSLMTAIIGLVVGLAAQRPLANFVAGVVIAFTQPLRLGDRVTVDDVEGIVEEIGLTYTFIRTADNARLVIPNEKLASDTIRNAT